MRIYRGSNEEGSALLDDIRNGIIELFDGCKVESKSFLDSILVAGKIIDISIENLKKIQGMNYNQIMFFTSEDDYESLILGAYDYESLFIVSQIDITVIDRIKELFKNRYGKILDIEETYI